MKRHATPMIVKLPAWRRRFLLIVLLVAFAALLLRGLYLQGVHKNFLQQKGEASYSRKITLSSHRGKILDRNGEILAMSLPVDSVYVNPPDVKVSAKVEKNPLEKAKAEKEITEKFSAMAKILDIDPKTLDKKISKNQKRGFVYIKRRISPELAQKVMRLEIPGVRLQREYKRYYPAAEVSAHLVGFTALGPDGVTEEGIEGLEKVKNEVLSGVDGSRRVLTNRAGQIVEDLVAVTLPKDGQDLVLSIDRRIQYLVYRELVKAVDKHQAKAASAVILDAKTGEVIAMANVPTYNPNNRKNIQGKMRNLAIVDMFEPGSTMKPISVSAGLESGNYTPETKIQTAPGYINIGPARIRDSHAHAVLSVAEIIQKSSNVGSSKIAMSLDRQYLWQTFNQIGFGSKTNIGFPGEASGRVRDFKKWRPVEVATMSFGNGISMTLLQLARAYTVFANDGELKPVSLMKLQKSPVGVQVFSAKTANQMKDMMEMVVLPGGTAQRARVAGYRVAGKTGTTHKISPTGGYEKDLYVASFVGLAPASNPRLIMAVMIDEPNIANDQYYGGVAAAPVFSAVMKEALRTLAVPQDAPNNNVVIAPDVPEDDVRENNVLEEKGSI